LNELAKMYVSYSSRAIIIEGNPASLGQTEPRIPFIHSFIQTLDQLIVAKYTNCWCMLAAAK